MWTLVAAPNGSARRLAGRLGAALAMLGLAATLGPVALAADPGSVPPLECSAGKVCREPRTFLPARVLTRPFSHVYKSAAAGKANILAENVTAFTALFVFAREGVDLSDPRAPKGWYQVGETATGAPLGWMQAADVVEWRQAIIVAFTHPGVGGEAREPVILFEDKATLDRLTGSEEAARKAGAQALYKAIEEARRRRGQAPDGVVSVEPGPFVDIREQFYMLPVLQFEDLGTQFTDEARHLQVVAVTDSRAESSDPEVPATLAGEVDAGTGGAGAGSDLQQLGIDLVFVMDMTGSMGPYIQHATTAITDIARLLTRDPGLADKIRFGFVGYRDDVRSMPQLEFAAKSYTPDGPQTVDRFLQVMATVNGDMARFIGQGLHSGDYQEELFAGLQTALDTRWSEPSLRFLVLIGDASSHEVGHPQATTGLDAPSLRQQLNAQRVSLVALHLKDERAAPDHALAQRQMTTLATNPGVDAATYFSTPAQDQAGYEKAVKEVAETLVGLLSQVRKGQAGAVVAGGGGQAGAGGSRVKAAVAKLGAAALVPYLGKEATPPRDITAWVFDRDLLDPSRPALEVRVLLDREQVNDLVFTAEKVSQAIKRAELTQMQFFEALQSVTTLGVKGEPIDYGRVTQLRGSGIAASWIETLPYKSQVLALTNDVYAALSPDERAQIEKGLDAKLKLYRELLQSSDIWVKLSERSADDDRVYPLELAALP
jgi:hypothetical protein